MSTFTLIILVVVWILMISVFIATISIAPWVPTKRKDLKRIVSLVDLQDGQTFVDLGCGTGTTVFAIGKAGKGKAVGIELSLPLYLYCKVKQFLTRAKNVEFRFGNAFKQDWSKFDLLYVFGMDSRMKKIKEKFFSQAKQGARLMSYAFQLEGVQPDFVSKEEKCLPISIYQKG